MGPSHTRVVGSRRSRPRLGLTLKLVQCLWKTINSLTGVLLRLKVFKLIASFFWQINAIVPAPEFKEAKKLFKILNFEVSPIYFKGEDEA